jgi:hypothetical protein
VIVDGRLVQPPVVLRADPVDFQYMVSYVHSELVGNRTCPRSGG